jgi:hypothetical protein
MLLLEIKHFMEKGLKHTIFFSKPMSPIHPIHDVFWATQILHMHVALSIFSSYYNTTFNYS